MSSEQNPTGLTNRELEVLVAGLRVLKDPKGLQVDYEKLAEAATFKTAASAKSTWCGIKRKLNLDTNGPKKSGNDEDAAEDEASTPKDADTASSTVAADGTPKRKRARKNLATPKTPSKRGKAAAKKDKDSEEAAPAVETAESEPKTQEPTESEPKTEEIDD